MLHEGQKNSTADLIWALHFQHRLPVFCPLLFALLAYMLYCPSKHIFLEGEIELFTARAGKKSAIIGINLLLNMLQCSLQPRSPDKQWNGKCGIEDNFSLQNIAFHPLHHILEDIIRILTQSTKQFLYGLVPKVNKDGGEDVTNICIIFYFSKKSHFTCFASVNKWKMYKSKTAFNKPRSTSWNARNAKKNMSWFRGQGARTNCRKSG